MKKTTSFVLFIFFICNLFAQKYDNMWLLGYHSQTTSNPIYGVSSLNFDIDTIAIKPKINTPIFFDITNASISNKDGKLLFYSNGIDIADASHKKMQGAPNPNGWHNLGQTLEQGCLILPYPNKSNYYLLFNVGWKWISTPTYQGVSGDWLNYFEIDMAQNNGLGAVTKNDTLLKAHIDKGRINATKHANGRDWWLLIHGLNSNEYYRYLVSPDGIQLQGIQTIGTPFPKGIGQCVFSPDGSKYIHYSTVNKDKGVFLDIYDFDRCAGTLSNHRQFNYLPNTGAGGVAISPNSRFLYVANAYYLDQYDLQASDVFATRTQVAEYDGFKPPEFPVATNFFMLQLAPNGKIYGCSTSGTKYLHIIDQPDSMGLACKVIQHGLNLPTFNAQGLPNFPNYRLGALKGSPCDTLQAVSVAEGGSSTYKVYPNPAQEVLYFYSSSPTTLHHTAALSIVDALGQELQKETVTLSSVNTIDVAHLANGFYFLSIKEGDKQTVVRFVVAR